MRTAAFRSPATPSAEFLRLCSTVELLRQQGLPDDALDALIREKVLVDLAHEEAKRRQPSLN